MMLLFMDFFEVTTPAHWTPIDGVINPLEHDFEVFRNL